MIQVYIDEITVPVDGVEGIFDSIYLDGYIVTDDCEKQSFRLALDASQLQNFRKGLAVLDKALKDHEERPRRKST